MDEDNQKFWRITPDNARRAYEIAKAVGNPKVIVDICCGTGKVISRLQELLPDTQCIGVDIETYPEWETSKAEMIQMPLQEFIKRPDVYDVVLMLNSFRNWEGHHKETFNNWLHVHADKFITSTNLPYKKTIIGTDVRKIDLEMYDIAAGTSAYETEI